MKYQISESQYRKIVLNYLNNVVSDFILEDDDYEDNNWVDVSTSGGIDLGSVWFNTIQNRGMITEGCHEELSLDEDFVEEFEQVIPIVIPKIFSQTLLEYFNSMTDLNCDCIEFTYRAGDGEDGSPQHSAYRYNINKH